MQLDLSGLRSTTRFQDLAPALQSEIENIDKAVTQQQDWCRELRAQLPGSETMINSLPTDVSHVTNRLDQCERALESDAASINVAKKLVAKDAEDARLSFGAVDVLKLPPQLRDFRGSSHPYSSSARPGPPIRLDFPNSGPEQARRNARNREDKGAEDLVSYFMDQSISMDKTLEGYRKNMDDVEDHLRIVEMKVLAKMQELTGMQNGSRHQKLNQPTPEQKMMAELRRTLLGFEQGVLAVAAKVGEVKEEVQELSVQRDKALLDRFDAM